MITQSGIHLISFSVPSEPPFVKLCYLLSKFWHSKGDHRQAGVAFLRLRRKSKKTDLPKTSESPRLLNSVTVLSNSSTYSAGTKSYKESGFLQEKINQDRIRAQIDGFL
ncbi:hypothetical protein TcWFU_001133 [Taenia crassiceps]|uniref:Uncharacterized protein n=1 Tax=Taenia crassiceps TaxID=6207 RepID=A0ABR4QL12_9CEST